MRHSFKLALKSGNRRLNITAVAAACLMLSACQTTGGAEVAAVTSQPLYGTSLDAADVAPGVKYWADKFQQNPHNLSYAIGLSRELRKETRYEDALGVMLRISSESDNDPQILAEMGKILVQRGSPVEGLALLDNAARRRPSDWTIISARGVALGELDRNKEAIEAFETALTYSPGNPSVLANLGLALATEGRLGEAENMLRKAVRHPDASKEVHLNLALIVGLGGDFVESEKIARAHLPPATVEENMTYLRSLLTQPARWRRPADDDFDQPEEMPS